MHVVRTAFVAWACAAAVASQASAQGQSQPIIPDAGMFARDGKTVVGGQETTIGRTIEDVSFIFGGLPSRNKYVVGISYVDARGETTCTGTLLDERFVLTAGHCGCGSNYAVTQSPDMAGGKPIGVLGRPILFDPRACGLPGMISPGYDLALLRLEKGADVDAEYSAPLRPAFALRELSRTGSEFLVVGFGRTEQGTKGRRMQAAVPVYTPDCAKSYFAAWCVPFREMMLSSLNRGSPAQPTDSCSGDSGGPVFAARTGADGRPEHILFAVTSRPAPLPHTDSQNHCGGGSINTIVGRSDVFFWLDRNGVPAGKAAIGP